MPHHPYLTTRDSGVPWLGQIPAHWDITQLKNAASVNPSKAEINHLPKNLEVSFIPMELIGEGTLITDNTKTLGDIGQGFSYFLSGWRCCDCKNYPKF
jgi:type I restriction enzyme S subunit